MELFEIQINGKTFTACGIDELEIRDKYEPQYGQINIRSLGPAPDDMWCEVAA